MEISYYFGSFELLTSYLKNLFVVMTKLKKKFNFELEERYYSFHISSMAHFESNHLHTREPKYVENVVQQFILFEVMKLLFNTVVKYCTQTESLFFVFVFYEN